MVKICKNCINCGMCYSSCPFNAIEEGGSTWTDENGKEQKAISDDHYFINPTKCKKCFKCISVCPIQNIKKNDDAEDDDDDKTWLTNDCEENFNF